MVIIKHSVTYETRCVKFWVHKTSEILYRTLNWVIIIHSVTYHVWQEIGTNQSTENTEQRLYHRITCKLIRVYGFGFGLGLVPFSLSNLHPNEIRTGLLTIFPNSFVASHLYSFSSLSTGFWMVSLPFVRVYRFDVWAVI